MRAVLSLTAALFVVLAVEPARAAIIAPDEDVMTSAFFSGSDLVRGYAGDNRPVFRASSDNAFGVGPETIYVDFSSEDFTAFAGPVTAILTMQSVDGGFGANAGPGNPFTVSAHGVNANPFTSITDDTNPGGPVSWSDFFANNILDADPAALTVVDAIDVAVTVDVSALVNDWASGAVADQVIALTGKNDFSPPPGFLHGFLNNTETPGSTFLTVTPIPEPSTGLLLLGGLTLLGRRRRVRPEGGAAAEARG